MRDHSLATAAAEYGRRGYPVFPLLPNDKRPRTQHGLNDATTSLEQIDLWWRWWPESNIAIRTGVVFDVLDIDDDAGLSALASLVPEGQWPIGPVVVTSAGTHTYMLPTGEGNRAGLVESVDFRGRGGYVVAPPSRHPSGHLYRWADGRGPEEIDLHPCPPWLSQLLNPPRRERTEYSYSAGRPVSRPERYAWSALLCEAEAVARAALHTRNNTLNMAAWRMRKFIQAGHLHADDVMVRLLEAAQAAGLGEREARATICSGLGTGR